jgi:hypothetical protein
MEYDTIWSALMDLIKFVILKLDALLKQKYINKPQK